jgi:hypothetical protein
MPPIYFCPVILTKIAMEPDRVTMPGVKSSYKPTTPYIPKVNPSTIYLVCQHSTSAGHSKMLPASNVVGVFKSHEDARKYLHELKAKHRPVVKHQAEEGEGVKKIRVWCAGDPNDEKECGFMYTSAGGEEYTVWIEEQELSKPKREGEDGASTT